MITATDITDAMQYSFSFTPESFTVAGYEVEIWRDSDTSNPYDDCDGMAPALWLSLRGGFTEYGNARLTRFFSHVPASWVSRHWRAIAAALDLSEIEHDKEAREDAARYGQSLSETRRELFANALEYLQSDSWGRGCDYLETLASLYNLFGWPAQTYERNGYCQGDSVRGLIVFAPDWVQLVGANPERAADDMRGQADTYGAWVWGDCYGYTVTRDGEDIGQCGGFIGGPDDSGLMDYLVSDINGDIETRRTERTARLKGMIRGRAPLDARAAYLASVPA